MAYRYTGLGEMSTPLKIQVNAPLDTRTVVDTTADLYQVLPEQAYRGMTISNLEDGNIYMLIDENKITTSDGWKSSLSALLIITCTQKEYDDWASNTNERYEPIEPEKPYLLQSVYYYIYEDLELGTYYLSSKWGKDIEDQLGKKAPLDEFGKLLISVTEDALNLKDNYFTKDEIIETYATTLLVNSLLDLSKEDSFISKTLSEYYKSDHIDETFLTKASLGGDIKDLEVEGEFVFVPTVQYKEYLKEIQEQLDKTLKVDGEGSLESITVGLLKSPAVEGKDLLVIDIKSDGLYIGEDPIATESDIPVIKPMTRARYEEELKAGIDTEAYYFIYDETNEKFSYVTLQYLEDSYSTTSQMLNWVATNYHNRTLIENLLLSLNSTRDANLATTLSNYYTINDANGKFLDLDTASKTYTALTDFSIFIQSVQTDYVKWSDIGNPEIEGDSFAFVTQDQYTNDKSAQSENFESKNIKSDKSTVSELVILKTEKKEVLLEDGTLIEQSSESKVLLTVKNNKLIVRDNESLSNEKQVAFTEEVPKLEYKTIDEYKAIVNPDSDTYYFVYDLKEENAWVTQASLENSYYTKSLTDLQIINANTELENKLRDKISELEAEIQTLKNLLYSSVLKETLMLGMADNIKGNVLVANTGKIENQTLIFT